MHDSVAHVFPPQLEVGSFQARVPSAPAAAPLSSAAQQATLLDPTASATPAWGATERPRTPATTPTAPPVQVRLLVNVLYWWNK